LGTKGEPRGRGRKGKRFTTSMRIKGEAGGKNEYQNKKEPKDRETHLYGRRYWWMTVNVVQEGKSKEGKRPLDHRGKQQRLSE